MRTIAHIVKPMRATPESEHGIAQPVTFESMRVAREFAANAVRVEHVAAYYTEEESVIPSWFTKTAPLTRAVTAVGSFRIPRPLPLIKDILDALYAVSNAEYFIYTNVDIALMPHFYAAVNAYIDRGYDAFVINRRTIPEGRFSPADLPFLYSEIGKPHPGYDCFVFRRDIYERYVLGDVCLGMGHVDLPLVISMITYAKKFTDVTDEHLTFHLGDSRTWWSWKYRDYLLHNDREAKLALRELASRAGISSKLRPHIRFLLGCQLLKNPMFVREWKRVFGFA